MQKKFSFLTLSYFFKQIVFCTLQKKNGLYALSLHNRVLLYAFYQTLFSTLLLYKTFLTNNYSVFLLSSCGMGRYNYQLFQYTNYFLNSRMDPREYTTRISTLTRKPYLNLFGTLKTASGLYLNLSSHGALLLRHLSKTSNVASSVALAATSNLFRIDYPLSLKNSPVNEKYYLNLLTTVAENSSRMTGVAQHLLYYKKYP